MMHDWKDMGEKDICPTLFKKPKLSCTYWWNLSQVSPKFFECSFFCKKKKRVREIQFHLVKILGQLLHLPISLGLFFLTFFYFYFFVSRLLRFPLGLKELLDCVEL